MVAFVGALPAGLFSVDIACPRDSLTWVELEGREGISLHAIRPHRRPNPDDLRSELTLLRLAGRADIVHVHSSKAGFLGRLASVLRAKTRACVFTPHGWSFWAADGAEARLYTFLERLAAGWCGAIVALSEDERRSGLDAGVGEPGLYRVIPNGVELERFALPREPVRGRILMVGRLAPPKRPDLAIRALAIVRERERVPEAELQIVGDGPLRAGAERLAAELGVSDRVSFLGHRKDVPELLAQADCALLASDYEGCPLSVVEAMAAGVPVAAMEAGGVAELVRAGTTGALGAHGDSKALARALEDVLGDPNRAAQMGSEARQIAAAELSLERMVGRLVALYDELAPPMPRTRDLARKT